MCLSKRNVIEGKIKGRRLHGPRALCEEQKDIPHGWDSVFKGGVKELRLKM